MGHDIYVYTDQGQLYYARFPMWAEAPALNFYCVFNAAQCYGGVSGTGESISITREDLGTIAADYNFYLTNVEESLTDEEKQFGKQISECLQAIENYFQNTPPSLPDETYFLIKHLPVSEEIAKRIASYSSEDKARVTVDFR